MTILPLQAEAELDQLFNVIHMKLNIRSYGEEQVLREAKAAILDIITKTAREAVNTKIDEAVNMAKRADDFVGDVKVVRVTHLLSLTNKPEVKS